MPKRVKHGDDDDTMETAARVVREATGEAGFPAPTKEPSQETISAVMAVLGRRGGLRGGKARAKALTKEQKSAIARKGARARWRKKPKE